VMPPDDWVCTCNAHTTKDGVSYHTFACLWPASPRPKDEPMPDLPIRKTTLNEVELTIDDLKKMLGIEPTAKVHIQYGIDESTGVQQIGSICFAWYVKEEG
jgi:hypothetical protein